MLKPCRDEQEKFERIGTDINRVYICLMQWFPFGREDGVIYASSNSDWVKVPNRNRKVLVRRPLRVLGPKRVLVGVGVVGGRSIFRLRLGGALKCRRGIAPPRA